MKCRYCNKELPKIVNSGREICGCEKSRIEWEVSIKIQSLKKQLINANEELKELKNSQSTSNKKREDKNENNKNLQ